MAKPKRSKSDKAPGHPAPSRSSADRRNVGSASPKASRKAGSSGDERAARAASGLRPPAAAAGAASGLRPPAAAARAAPKPSVVESADGSRKWVAVAEIARPHGVRGELRLRVYSGDPTLLIRRPPIRLRAEDGKITDAVILATRHADKALLVQLDGVADRDAAEAMRGKEVLVERDAFEPLEEDEFYACDIEGARAELSSGELIGTVTGLGSYPTCDVLLIEHEGKRLEVPLLPHFVESVDVGAKLVKILTLEGIT